MKEIKIDAKNIPKIEHALHKVNGTKECKHTFAVTDIMVLAEHFRITLIKLGLRKINWEGAKYNATSSRKAPSGYKFSRKGNYLTFRMGKAGKVYLTDLESTQLYPEEGGTQRVLLTQEQDAIVIERYRKNNYIV